MRRIDASIFDAIFLRDANGSRYAVTYFPLFRIMENSKSPATKADIENLVSLFTESHEATQRRIGQVEESTQSQFDRIDRRFDGLDSRIESMDLRIGGLDKRMDGMDQRIDGLTNLLQDHISESNRRFDILNDYADQILANVCNITDELLTNHERRLQRLEKHLEVVA